MKSIQFSLDKILSLRTFYEKEAEIALGKAVSERDAIQLELNIIAIDILKTYEKLVPSSLNISMPDLIAAENYIKGLKIKKEALLQELVLAEDKINSKRKEYIEASKKRQVLSRLKEKKITEWKKECLREEDNFIDDLVTFRNNNTDNVYL